MMNIEILGSGVRRIYCFVYRLVRISDFSTRPLSCYIDGSASVKVYI